MFQTKFSREDSMLRLGRATIKKQTNKCIGKPTNFPCEECTRAALPSRQAKQARQGGALSPHSPAEPVLGPPSLGEAALHLLPACSAAQATATLRVLRRLPPAPARGTPGSIPRGPSWCGTI